MENQSNNSILFDYELEVDGVIYRELKSLNREVVQDGHGAAARWKEKQVLVHTRYIGDKSYTVKKIDSEDEETDEVVEENNMTCLEVAAFQEDWSKMEAKLWGPTIRRSQRNFSKIL